MKKFNEFSEALLVALKPSSDAIAPVEQCPCQQQDMLTQTANGVMHNLGGEDVVQPNDDIGEYGNNQSEGDDQDQDGVELECTEDGLRVKFSGVEIVLPKNVVDKIKEHTEDMANTEHEAEETPEEEAEERETGIEDEEDEENEEDEEDEEKEEKEDKNIFESFKKNKKNKKNKKDKWVPPWIKNKDDKSDKSDKKDCKCKNKGK